MTRSTKLGSRGRQAALVGALVAAATMAIGAGSASAASVNLNQSFDDAALTLPIVGTSDIMDPPNTATIGGTNVIDNGTGVFSGAALTFPSFTGTASGVPVKVDFTNVAPIGGTLNLATGVETTTMSAYEADVTINPPSGTTCKYNPVNLVFTTTGGTPIAGDPFTVAAGPPVSTTQGVLTANWTNSTFPSGVTTPPGGDCSLVDNIVHGGNGQLALGNGFDLTPAAPAPPASGGGTVAPPPKKKCKKAKKKSSAQIAKKKGCKKKKKK